MFSITLITPSPLKNVLYWPLLLLIVGMLTGCAAGYGRIQHDDEVTRMFTSGDLPQDYVYYFNGRDHIPYALIGISPEYRHISNLWDEVDPKSDEFRSMVDNMWQPAGQYYTSGAYILDNNGNRIGIWLAKYHFATVELGQDNEVTVHSPYRPNQRHGG